MNIEATAAIQLLSGLIFDPRTALVISLLTLAAWSDCLTHRIPNALVFSGTAMGLIYNTVYSSFPEGIGFASSLAGCATGLGMFLPFYLLRVMGAGDVKLMAMVGAFLGPWDTMMAAFFSCIVGGVMALGYSIASGTLSRMLTNIFLICRGAVLDLLIQSKPMLTIDAGTSVGKLPYGIAIAMGATGFLAAKQLGLY
jgi:prepilin peptidase CpaA